MNNAELGQAIRRLMTAWIEWQSTVEALERGEEINARVDGYRVVNGGQTGSDGSWEITDAASGEILARGTDFQTFEAAWRPEWIQIDNIGDAAMAGVDEPKAIFGLPPRFASVLADFTLTHPDESRSLLE